MVPEDQGETESRGDIPAIVVTGPPGAGKTTTIIAISSAMGSLRRVVLDIDHLRWVDPDPEGDRFGVNLGYRNLAAIWPNLVGAGVRCALLADIVESRDQVRCYEEAMPGANVTVVRLDVSREEIARRLVHRQSPGSLEWYVNRAAELQGIMEREGVGDIVITVDGHTPQEIALEIMQRVGIDPS